MWRLFLGMTLLGLFCFPLQLQATASSLASQASAATSTGQGISITSQGIQIRVNERPLLDILKDIQHLSGIDFLLSPDIEGISVTTTIDAPDWPTAVQQLLRSFR